MYWEGEHRSARWRWRQRLALVILAISLISSVLVIVLHYQFSRRMALSAAEDRYELTVAATRDYLSNIDKRASQTVRILARHPNLMNSHWIHSGTPELFAEVMRSNPVFYAIYIGFPNGDFYELVNLNTSEAVRRQLQAMPSDRWVEITVQGEGEERRRRFTYLNENLEINYSRSERSDYDASKRLWFTSAGTDQVNKTPPYLFQHLQAAGQSFSLQIPGSDKNNQGAAVLTVDVAFSALSDQLRGQSLSAEGEIFLFQRSGELLATNRPSLQQQELPVPPVIPLSDEQQLYIAQLGKLRVANEPDWAPIDFVIAGEPKGYSVDLLRVLARMTGLQLEFVNGYNWPELTTLFEQGELDILQPVIDTGLNRDRGLFTQPWMTLDYALVTRDDADIVRSLDTLGTRLLVMPDGWSVNAVLRERYPDMNLRIVSTTRKALEMVQNGLAYATLDSETILRRTADQFLLSNLKFHRDIAGLGDIPATLHFQIRHELATVRDVLDKAIAELPDTLKSQLEARWLQDNPLSQEIALTVVPYPDVLRMAEQGRTGIQRTVMDGQEYYVFVSLLNRTSSQDELFAFVVPVQQLFSGVLADVKRSALLLGLFWLILMPLLLILLLRPLGARALNSDS